MFTLPENTIAYLLKEPIDMRYGMFRLQGALLSSCSKPCYGVLSTFSSTKGHSTSSPPIREVSSLSAYVQFAGCPV